jgi:gliding motility-associated-like protein
MKQLLFFAFLIIALAATAQTTCGNDGNIVIFSNYDGGFLTIDVNVDIPNLKIGIASYEPSQVTITGTYASNVTEVLYAGFFPLTGTGNFHCDASLAVGSVALPAGSTATTDFLDYPPVTLIETAQVELFPGYFVTIGNNNGILCSYNCQNGDTGGANTSNQIIDYFAQTFGGTVRFLKTQYGCWCGSLDMAQPTSCCYEIPPGGGVIAIQTTSPAVCNGSSATLSVNGNFSTYSWSTGQSSPTISVNAAGTYSVTTTGGCGQNIGEITIIDCPAENCINDIDDDGDGAIDALDTDCICTSPNSELIIVNTMGSICGDAYTFGYNADPDIEYTWLYNGMPVIGQTDNPWILNYGVEASGNYQVIGIDAAGNCFQSASIDVLLIDGQSITGNVTSISCGTSLGSIAVSISPSTTGYTYTYLWNTGATLATINNLDMGTYTVTTTNNFGCERTASFEITGIEPLEMEAYIINPGCNNSNGSLEIIASGGTMPYYYSINGGSVGEANVFNLVSGTYSAQVTDANGCTTEILDIVIDPQIELPTITIDGPDGILLLGDPFTLTATISPPNSTYPLTWQPAEFLDCDTCESVSGIAIQSQYSFAATITLSSDCSVTEYYTFNVDNQTNYFIPTAFTPDDSGKNDRFTVYLGPGVAAVKSFEVYDRWGTLISVDPAGWDGTYRGAQALDGVYSWFIVLTFLDGSEKTEKGSVTLIR